MVNDASGQEPLHDEPVHCMRSELVELAKKVPDGNVVEGLALWKQESIKLWPWAVIPEITIRNVIKTTLFKLGTTLIILLSL